MRKPLAVSISVIMAAVLSVGTTASSSSAAPARKFALASSAAAPWPGEATTLSGRVAPKKRVVELQKRRGAKWVRVKRSRTRSGGKFQFSVRATAVPTNYRVVAPKHKIKHKTLAKRLSQVRQVRQVQPQVNLSVTPGVVRVSPIRIGAPMSVQRRVGNTWRTVVSAKLPATGSVEFVPDGSSVYRAAVLAPRANRWVYSTQVRSKPLVWSDEFDRPALNGADWQPRDVDQHHGKRLCSSTSPRNASLVNGRLRLKLTENTSPRPDIAQQCKLLTGGVLHQAMVGTQASKSFTHGVFAARIKFQSPQGMHGAFWLQSSGQPEIDVAEYFGDGRGTGGLAHFLHNTRTEKKVGGENAKAKSVLTHGRHTPSTDFHVYSVEWTSSGYVFRVDGVETLRTTQLRSNDPHFLVLSILSSDDNRRNLDKRKLPQAFIDVDWVRVWK